MSLVKVLLPKSEGFEALVDPVGIEVPEFGWWPRWIKLANGTELGFETAPVTFTPGNAKKVFGQWRLLLTEELDQPTGEDEQKSSSPTTKD